MLGKSEGKKRRGRERMRWLDSITNLMDKNLSKFQEIVENLGAWLAAVHGVAKKYTTLSDPIDCSPPGPSLHGIFQIRILEWVAISFSRGSS